jgi:hexulose-6-phosphate isomerase
MKKGICQTSFPSKMPLEVMFEHTRKAGFDTLELSLSLDQDGPGLTMFSTEVDISRISQAARDNGVELHSLMCGAASQYLGSPDGNARKYGREIILKQLEMARILGMNTILTVPARITSGGPSYADCWQRSTEELRQVLPVAETHQISMAIENVRFSKFLLSDEEMIRYVDQFNSPYLGVYCDIGNILFNGFPEKWIRSLNKRIRKIHFKDLKASANYASVPLLYGDVNWPEVMKAIRDIGYDDVLTAEINPSVTYPLQAIYDTSRHIDAIFNGEAG